MDLLDDVLHLSSGVAVCSTAGAATCLQHIQRTRRKTPDEGTVAP